METKTGFMMERRDFIKQAGAIGIALLAPGLIVEAGGVQRPAALQAAALTKSKADVALRIGPVLVELDKIHTISTIGYNS